MIANALNDKPLPVYGEGINVRDWLYVEHHCKAIDLILHNGKVGEVYEGVTELTDKELRKGHDIRKIWIGGGFDDYFYE